MKTLALLLLASLVYGSDIVTSVIVLEAQGEGREGMEAVASVIRNRSVQQHKTMEQIVLAPRQFSCLNAVDAQKAIRKARTSPVWGLASSIESKARCGALNDPVFGATHYYAYRRIDKPYWAYKMHKTAVIGGHAFYAN